MRFGLVPEQDAAHFLDDLGMRNAGVIPAHDKLGLRVVEVRAQVFGSEHPDTLRSRNRLAYALWRQGHHAEADTNFRQVVILEEKYSALRIQTPF